MKLNRRNFLGAAAVSPLTAKETAKRALEQLEMEAAGVGLYTDSMSTYIPSSAPTPPLRSLWEAIGEIGVPDWKQEDLREDARRSRTLDPDIAAMRSLSLDAKLRMQWERNYKILVRRALRQTQLERIKQSFFEKNPDITEY
ncbi:MAG: hypothetical protein AB7O43_06200 [Hyphomicrobiaceae bacterium]